MIDNRDTRLLNLRKRFFSSLPDRVAAIMETLRQRQNSADREGTLDRQFHNLAGTAGTFGFFAIAAVAIDGFDECAGLNGARIEGDARYLWSIVEELANEACDPMALERATEAVFQFVNGTEFHAPSIETAGGEWGPRR